MTEPKPHSCWCRLTPDRVVLLLLVMGCLLWLSNRLGWPAWQKGYAVLVALALIGIAAVLMLLWLIVCLLFRWRFQFGIRFLLMLTVLVALLFGWPVAEIRKAREQRAAVEMIEN